jgi:phosphoglucosamine mutase
MEFSSRKLFGTDGIRGIAGEFPLTLENTFIIGRALGRNLAQEQNRPRVVIGQDTRESSSWIADRVALGLSSAGCEVESAGVITTPGIAYLARARRYSAGVVISASHNPWTDNGIKVFSGNGYKLPDSRELAIEHEIFAMLQDIFPQETNLDPAPSLPGKSELRHGYVDWLAATVKEDLTHFRMLVDCANGAATAEAPELFRRCGINATFLNAAPDGRNINENSGALHPEVVARAVAAGKKKYDLGVTFDGDADRVLFSDAEGRVVNGDAVLFLCARDFLARGALTGSMIVSTTMSNMGLEIALRNSGVRMIRASVGDKYVLEEMRRSGAVLGGEQSGHILFRDGEATTGDGLLTALRVIAVMARSGKSLAALVSDLKTFPQIIQNIPVREKKPFSEVPAIQHAITDAERELDGNGRIVVRYSGTESLARVMVEAESEDKMRALATNVAAAIKTALGP